MYGIVCGVMFFLITIGLFSRGTINYNPNIMFKHECYIEVYLHAIVCMVQMIIQAK